MAMFVGGQRREMLVELMINNVMYKYIHMPMIVIREFILVLCSSIRIMVSKIILHEAIQLPEPVRTQGKFMRYML